MRRLIEPFILFTLVFTVFFSSSVGLMNSGDAPQYFTGEALLKHASPDLVPFKEDPHFFVWPDYYEDRGRVLSYRGFTTSLLSLPFHMAGRVFSPFFETLRFPVQTDTDGFPRELATVSFFTVFSAAGIMALWKIMRESGIGKFTRAAAVLLTAFGTYIWKYSSFYSRHGVIVFLLALFLFSFWRLLKGDKNRFVLALPAVISALAFGIDSILCISFLAVVILYHAALFLGRKQCFLKPFHHIPGVLVFMIIIILNWFYYGNVLSVQSLRSFQFEGIPMENRLGVATSAPLHIVLPAVLFNAGKLPSGAFTHFDTLPSAAAVFTSVQYAKINDFYGMFVLSPFLVLGFVFPLFRRDRRILFLNGISVFLFFLNMAGNAKFYAFWGGNQYDIRYFYPFCILLVIPFAQVADGLLRKGIGVRIATFLAVVLTGIWSMFQGFLGVIGMYHPSLGGERRIMYASRDTVGYTREDYVNAAFMNRDNAWIAVAVTLFIFSLYLIIFSLFSGRKTPQRGFSGRGH
jgi:hypothetical protein